MLINQLAFPGLGTVMAGRRAGYPQAALMVIGFVFVMGFLLCYLFWVVQFMQQPTGTEEEFAARYRPYLWSLYAGAVLCVIAWTWSLISSVAILKSARDSAERPAA